VTPILLFNSFSFPLTLVFSLIFFNYPQGESSFGFPPKIGKVGVPPSCPYAPSTGLGFVPVPEFPPSTGCPPPVGQYE